MVIQDCQVVTEGSVSYTEFANIYHKIMYPHKLFKDYFEIYSNSG